MKVCISLVFMLLSLTLSSQTSNNYGGVYFGMGAQKLNINQLNNLLHQNDFPQFNELANPANFKIFQTYNNISFEVGFNRYSLVSENSLSQSLLNTTISKIGFGYNILKNPKWRIVPLLNVSYVSGTLKVTRDFPDNQSVLNYLKIPVQTEVILSSLFLEPSLRLTWNPIIKKSSSNSTLPLILGIESGYGIKLNNNTKWFFYKKSFTETPNVHLNGYYLMFVFGFRLHQ